MHSIEKTISNIIKTQFPAFYKEEGNAFIQFVTEYYKWLESKTLARDEFFNEKKSTITVASGNNIIIGLNTAFLDEYKANDKIGLSENDGIDEYEIYTVSEVVNNNKLILTKDKLPNFSSTKAKHGTISLHANPLYYARRFFEAKDIDETFDEFILYFKEKYLKNIQFKTQTQIKKMVKNSLDLYRSKGTERSVDLLFKIVFGVPAEIYYPARDLFRLSDGQWYQPKYLEVSIHEDLPKFVGKQIKGLNSGATAFVESVVRKNINGKLIDVLYISAIRGNFETNEKLNTYDNLLNVDLCPIIVGSLTEILLDILGTGEGFTKGDIVDVISDNGKNAKARVKETIDTTGFISFTLLDGGYGYSACSQVLVAERMIQLNNVVIDANNKTNEYFYLFDNLTQPYAFINFEAANGTFANGDMVYTYHYGNGAVRGTGKVLNAEYSNSTAGKLTVSTISGNLNVLYPNNGIFKTANAIKGSLSVTNGYYSMTATANVIGTTPEATLTVSNIVGKFANNEEIYQINATSNTLIANGSFAQLKNVIVSNGIVTLSNTQGVFKPSVQIKGRSSNTTATVQSVSVTIGVKSVTSPLTKLTGNYVTFGKSNTSATIVDLSSGAYANAQVSSLLNYPETISGYFDNIGTYQDLLLSENAWGFPQNPTANLDSGEVIAEILQYSSINIGSVSTLVSINPGEGYTTAPLVKIYDPRTYIYKIPDRQKLTITNPSSAFSVGEVLTQPAANARGLVTFSNSSTVYIKNLRFYEKNHFSNLAINAVLYYKSANNTFTINTNIYSYHANNLQKFSGKILSIDQANSTSGSLGVQILSGNVVSTGNTGKIYTASNTIAANVIASQSTFSNAHLIRGKNSGTTANVSLVENAEVYDVLGFDALVKTDLRRSTGGIYKIDVIDSGFGYNEGEVVTLHKENLTSGTGLTRLLTSGTGSGYYKKSGGFLSSEKRVFDAYYWQEYSYEVRSSVTLDRYFEMLKNVVHVSGTKLFGSIIYSSINTVTPNAILDIEIG